MASLILNKRRAANFLKLCIFTLAFILSPQIFATTPTFSVALSPTTITPGGVSTATFTIDQSAQSNGVSSVGFSVTLPAGMTVATVPAIYTDCPSVIYSAAAGGSSISFSDARIAGGSSCTFEVDLTSSTAGTHTLTTSSLSTSAGSVTAASANLTVDNTELLLSAALSATTIQPGEVSTLTYTLDGSGVATNLIAITFGGNFPVGVVLADAPNFNTTCTGLTGTFNGGDVSFTLSNGSLNAGSSCTASLDVTSSTEGYYKIESNAGSYYKSGSFIPLTLQASSAAFLTVAKNTVSSVFSGFGAPGASLTLDFQIRNVNRENDITALSFTNDLNATLSGLVATSLPSTGFCGSGSTISGSSTLSISNVSLASGASCEFSITVLVPANAAAGNYTNTTSTINLTLGTATTLPAVSTTLRVFAAPSLTISTSGTSLVAGDNFTSTFTLTNTDSANSVTGISFFMDIAQVLPSGAIVTLPSANSCGTGSTFTNSPTNDTTARLSVSSASLAPGASCNFSVVFSTPVDTVTGTYTFTTTTGNGTINGSSVPISPVSTSVTVEAAPGVSMALSSTTVVPGGSFDIQFNVNHSASSAGDATNGAFSLDLNSVVNGMQVSSDAQSNFCGTGSSASGTGILSVSGLTLSPDTTCQFTVTVSVPNDNTIVGSKTLTTTALTANVSSLNLTGSTRSATLLITGLSFSHEFVPSRTLPSSTVIARYTIVNAAGADTASAIQFTHSYSSVITAMTVTGSLPTTPCGGNISGTSTLVFSNATLNGGETCTFDVSLSVPANASDGIYKSVTSGLSATVGGNGIALTESSTNLTVESLTVLLSTTETSPTSLSLIPVTIAFSRDVTGFVSSDLQIGNGTVSSFSGSGSSYSASITPSASGTVTIDLPANAVDDAGDSTVKNPAATQLSIEYEASPTVATPTISIASPSSSLTNSGPVTFGITYSNADEVSLTNNSLSLNKTGTATGTLSVLNGTTSTPTVTVSNITGEGTLGVSISGGSSRNGSKTDVGAGPSATFSVDNTAPSVTIVDQVANPYNAAFQAQITFSENVTGFTVSDLTFTNANLSNFSGSNNFYTVTVTPTGDGNVTGNLAANSAQDSAGNGNTAAPGFGMVYDATQPSVSISSASTSVNSAFTTTFTFSEDVTGFAVGDISATNASLSNFNATSASVYTATVTPVNEGDVTLNVAANVASDSATNNNTAATQYSVNYDTTVPTVTITGPTTAQNAAFTATFTFSEDVTGFAVGDISATNASLSNFASTSASVYTATVTPTADGSVTLDVAANVAIDAASNNNIAATQYSVSYDATKPTLSISGPSVSTNGAFTATFTFSEDVTGFAAADVSVSNANLSNFAATSAKVYSATVTPSSQGSVTLDVAADAASDSAGNGNTAATQFSVVYDSVAPTVNISSASTSVNSAFTATFTFSEDVTGFAVGDISATNASLSNFAATSAKVYTATVTPDSEGTVALNVAANVAIDAVGNGNITATQYSVTYDSTAPILISSTPSDGNLLVQVDTNLVLQFSEAIFFNPSSSGILEVIRLSDTSVELENTKLTLNAGNLTGQGVASISGTTLTINLDQELKAGGSYAVRISGDLLNDVAGNAYSGISTLSGLNFYTMPAVQLLVDKAQLIEEKEETANVTVALRSADGQPVTASSSVLVNLSFAGSTASSGADYNTAGLVNNQVTIVTGSSQASFTITTINDSPLADEPEQVLVSIDTIPSNNALEETAQQVTVSIVENAVPEVTNLPTQFTIQEDTKTHLVLSDVNVSDTEGDDLLLNLSVSQGRLLSPLGSSGGIVVTQSSSSSLQLAGSVANINAFLDNSDAIAVIPVLNSNEQFIFTMTLTDGTETSGPLTVPINITAINDVPELINGQLIQFDMSGGDVATATSYTETVSEITMTLTLDAGNLEISDLQTFGGTEGQALFSNSAPVTNSMEVSFTEKVNIASLQFFFLSGTTARDILITPTGGTGAEMTVPATKFAIDGAGSKISFNGWNGISGLTFSSTSGAFAAGIDDLLVSAASSDITVTEDVAFPLDFSALNVSDVDSQVLNLDISVPSGSFSVKTESSSGAAISTTSNNISVSGTVSQIDAFLGEVGNVEYIPEVNVNGDQHTAISLMISDSDGSGAIVRQVINIDITAVNDAPVISNLSGDSINYTQATGPVVLDVDQAAVLSDVDDTDFNGGVLVARVISGGVSADDMLSLNAGLLDTGAGAPVLVNGIEVGELENPVAVGNDLIINLNANATTSRVSELLQAITYFNSNTIDTTFSPKQISIQVSDGDDFSDAAIVDVLFTPLDRDTSFVFAVPSNNIGSGALSQSSAQTAVVIDISDSGNDGVATTITGINFTVTGSLNPENMSFILRQVNEDTTSTIATYIGDYANGVLRFNDTIVIANGSSNISLYLDTWFNDIALLSDNANISFSLTPSTDVLVSSTGSQIGTSAAQQPVTLTLNIEATQLLYSQQPDGLVSGIGFDTTPEIRAVDDLGVVDIDYSGLVTLSASGDGVLSGNSATAVAGVATFKDLKYSAIEDNELILLVASSSIDAALISATSENIIAQVIATNIQFDAQPAPLSILADTLTQFDISPSLSAVNSNGILDADYFGEAVLQIVNAPGIASLTVAGDQDFDNETVTLNFDSGLLTFESLQVNYESQGSEAESFNFLVSSGTLNNAISEVVTVENNPKIVGLPDGYDVVEDEQTDIDLSTLVLDESLEGTVTMTITVNSGTIIAFAGDGSSGNLEISGSGTSVLTLKGTIADLSAFLEDINAIQYLSALNDDGQDTLLITVSDGELEFNASAVLAITPVNDAPVITGQASTTVQQGAEFRFSPSATDIDSDVLSFSIVNQPDWSEFDIETGVLSGVPGAEDLGLYPDIVVGVTDGEFSAQLPAFSIEVLGTNSAPVANAQSVTVLEDNTLQIQLTGTDAEQDNLSFKIIDTVATGSLALDGAIATFRPPEDASGYSEQFSFVVSDGVLESTPATVTITIQPVNDAPIIVGEASTTVVQGTEYRFSVSASDVDSDILTFSIANQPDWASFDTVSGLLLGVPEAQDVGVYSDIVIGVSDGELTAHLAAFSIEVLSNNSAPVAHSQSLTVLEDNTLQIQLTGSDPDEDNLSFKIVDTVATGSLTLDGAVATFQPMQDASGYSEQFSFSVSDGEADSEPAIVTIEIQPVNDAPVITGTPLSSVKVFQPYSFTPTASDIDSENLIFSVSNAPDWAVFDFETGRLSGQPGSEDAGVYSGIEIKVSDGDLTAQLSAFRIEVQVNNPPVIEGTPPVVVATGEQYSFVPQAKDVDNDTLTFKIVNKPSWAQFDSTSGTLTGVPLETDVGSFNGVRISVSDGINSVALPSFNIRVCEVCDNSSPVISGSPATSVIANQRYTFTPESRDADDDTLTFSIDGLPVWASFNTATGQLSGTPLTSNVGVFSGIVISVSDGVDAVSLASFNIEVLSDNSSPSLAGTPVTEVFQGERYDFKPVAVDSDSDTLVFSINNRPAWASFNPQNGRLRGTPGIDDVASYSNIVISVSDGINPAVSLPAFAIEVLPQNSKPVISGQPRTAISVGSSYSFSPTASDADGDALEFSVTSLPDWLEFNTTTGALIGVPQEQDVGISEEIVISVSDAQDVVSLDAFTINVVNENEAPVASDVSATVAEDSRVTIRAQISDGNGDAVTLNVITLPQNGVLSATNSGWIYTPDPNFNGEDSFVYQADDGELQSSTATVTVQVTSVNDKPDAIDDIFEFEQTESGVYILDVLTNDEDPDVATNGDVLTLQQASTNFGEVNIVDNQLQFVAGESFIGTVNLNYSVRDTSAKNDKGKVTLTVVGVDDINAPILQVPDDINIDALGLLTKVDFGTATAVDAEGNDIPVRLVSDQVNFMPGSHAIFWQAEDRYGSVSTEVQIVNINPIVSVSADESVPEGGRIQVRVILNGDAPVYPYIVNYSVTGTSDGNGVDHDAASGSVTFDSGQIETFDIDVFSDSTIEGEETIVVQIDEGQNSGANNSTSITITESNISPLVSLQLQQNQEARSTVARDEGLVSIIANVSDPNPQDSLTTEWTAEGLVNTSDVENVFLFDPGLLAPVGDGSAIYQVSVFVSDDGEPVQDASTFIDIEVVDSFSALSETADSDGDLIPDSQEGYGDSDGDGVPDYLDAIDDCNVIAAQADNQDEFLVEAEPGVCMKLGETSSVNDSNGLQVILTEPENRAERVNRFGEKVVLIATGLPEDRGYENSGGIYDFVLYDLPIAGQSARVVIPQSKPLPENAVYRKYNADTELWTSFVQDDKNKLFSAKVSVVFVLHREAQAGNEV